jgi:hypothetical protein
MDPGEHADRLRFLIRDRDSKFTGADIRIIRTPVGHPGRTRSRSGSSGRCAGNASTTF